MSSDAPEAVINPERIDFLRKLVADVETFVAQVYVADVLAVAPFYPEWFKLGEGLGISWLTAIPLGQRQRPDQPLFPAGHHPGPRSLQSP